MSLDAVSIDDLCRLLELSSRSTTLAGDLAERRRVALIALGELLKADAGHWSWGRGNPITSVIAPVAIVEFGYSEQQRTLVIEHAVKPQSIADFQARLMPLLEASGHAGVARRQLISDDVWAASTHWRQHVHDTGLDSWVYAVHYADHDTWSAFHLQRLAGREEFTPHDAGVLEAALVHVAWFNATPNDAAPPQAFVDMTPRQRTVMLMLLDGMPRKEIAARLRVTEHTIDDHLKAVYVRFGVRSVAVLAAKFLKMA